MNITQVDIEQEGNYEIAYNLHKSGNLKEAEEVYREILAANPKHSNTLYMLGYLINQKGDNQEALRLMQESVKINPKNFVAQSGLGVLCQSMLKLKEAEEAYKAAIIINPADSNTYINLGNVLRDQGRVTEAIKVMSKAVAINQKDYAGFLNLGNFYADTGRCDEALKYYRRAAALNPLSSYAQSNFLMILHYDELITREELFKRAQEWAEKFAPEQLAEKHYFNEKNPNRKLRIGYISGDLKNHPVGYYMKAVLSNHDKNNFDIYCYVSQSYADSLTLEFKNQVGEDRWRDILPMDDMQAANLIHKLDNIDILVDLSGHSGHNRLGIFARKPAPIQATWIGYFDTTGMKQIDYIICDKYIIPPEDEKYYTEKPLRLDDFYLCMENVGFKEEVKELAAKKNGYITFASFNNTKKLNDNVINCWSKILLKVPGSKLFLKSMSFADPEICKRYIGLFEKNGVAGDRIRFSGHSYFEVMLQEYNECDIALDPFPFNGNTTTSHALTMGLPMITLKGKDYVSRMGEGIMNTIGHPEWVVKDVDEYVEVAVRLASDIDKLAEIRKNLRGEFLNSPMCNGKQFTANLEKLYRQVWQEYCSKK